MLRWSAVFFLISIIAGVLGYTNISGTALGFAQVLFVIFLIPAVILLLIGMFIVGSTKR